MTAEEMFVKSWVEVVYLPITSDLIAPFKKSCTECDIEILEQERYNDKVVMFKLKLSRGLFNIFQAGAITQINSTYDSKFQKGIDDIFKDRLQ